MERRIVDYVIDCFFIVDCLLNFRTTYHVEETNELVASTRTIARRYVRGTSAGIGVGWFWPDAIGALPWDLTGARGLKLLKLLRVFQLRKPIAGLAAMRSDLLLAAARPLSSSTSQNSRESLVLTSWMAVSVRQG